MDLIPRHATSLILAALADTPVVVVNGARQAGKSTLVRSLEIPGRSMIVTLDDMAQREAARLDPRSFVERPVDTLVIDEVQLVPSLFRAIKASVDRDRRAGRFLLTGSSRLLSAPDMADSLAGRVELIDLWPLSQAEISREPGGFVDMVFDAGPADFAGSDIARGDYLRRIARGGFPEAIARSGQRRRRWFESYATTVAQRVVAEVADVERVAEIPRILRICAARTGTELNVRSLAGDLGISARTLDAYLAHLVNVFLIQLVPSWSTNLSAKVVRRPKLLVPDSGLATFLAGVRLGGDSPQDAAATGRLVETFVGAELRRLLSLSQEPPALAHFRDRGGREVDYVLEHPDGRVVGIEVKASATVGAADVAGLRFLEARLGERFHRGVLLYLGPEAVPFGPRLLALPLSSLWTAGAPGT